MLPTLRSGQLVLAVRGFRARKGDLVVVEHPERPGFEMVKRVSAGPGDQAMPGWVLGDDQWLVLGDNREASTDSREFGALSRSAIKGRVLIRF